MLAKTNTFVVSGLIHRSRGSFSLRELGGLFKENPLLAILFIIPAFALAGIPPLSGFFAKFMLIRAGIEDGHFWITGVAVMTGLLTLYSMIKIWNEAFLKKPPETGSGIAPEPLTFKDLLPSIILGLATIAMGIFAGPLVDMTMQAAELLLDPTQYIETVMSR
jgi:multicomponent Na+:H+ antiporter subunit D